MAAWVIGAGLVALPIAGALRGPEFVGRHSWPGVGAGAAIGLIGGGLLLARAVC